jgi:arsenate reductase
MLAKLHSTITIALRQKISEARKRELEVLINYLRAKADKAQIPLLNFICTHNSRRSQFSQIWAQTAAAYYSIKVKCFSGGVEVTAFNERAVSSLIRSGFSVEKKGETNPHYYLQFDLNSSPIIAFSKLYDDEVNPQEPFAAVMTCAHADENCPFIPNAEQRISIRYEDPKAYDQSPLEAKKYDERSLQIASEMLYVFSQVKP